MIVLIVGLTNLYCGIVVCTVEHLGYPNTSGLNEISSVRITEFVRISESTRLFAFAWL